MTAAQERAVARERVAKLDAEGVILALCYVLLGDGTKKDRGLLNLMIGGRQHVPRCPRGQWNNPNSPRPDGDPCSDRCVRAHAVLSSAEVWLKDHEVESQTEMFSEVAG